MKASPDPIGPPARPTLLPYPHGWFTIAFSHELKAGTTLRRRLMGEDVVAYRTRSGRLRVVRPYCPHLGAHLGVGGTVDGENLVCPFHHFAFDPKGTCVRTPYGMSPPKANLLVRESRESDGLIWVWQHPDDSPPGWEMPTGLAEGYSRPVCRTFTASTYPQEVMENAFDVGHFGTLHGFSNSTGGEPQFSDHRFVKEMGFSKSFPTLGTVQTEIVVEGHGLGFFSSVMNIPKFRTRMLTLGAPTEVDPGQVQFRLAFFMQEPQTEGISSPLRKKAIRAGSGVLSRLLLLGLAAGFHRDVHKDIWIWESKTYREHPRLARGEGQIMTFRHWADQFYDTK
ncbi:Rieske 2Fe-2S domain-containing protein [Streptomyces sp. NPDC054950]